MYVISLPALFPALRPVFTPPAGATLFDLPRLKLVTNQAALPIAGGGLGRALSGRTQVSEPEVRAEDDERRGLESFPATA